ncbi:uncharacterized protein LOC130979381 [Arachis stenosperma]|uniref:uncharacterized protein LOC130979381 n=1 Tax=Arachis stenosperma TaxID=217475 RepID=UPI0025AD1F4E|nr:uncharacterized protein LOC130979381 [Arachis stenosperma]
MVLPGLNGDRGTVPAPESMATSPKRSNRLHNFNLPHLKWGSQKYLRCTNSAGSSRSSSGDRRSSVSMSDESPPRRKRETEQERNHSVAKMPRSRINGKGRSGADGVKDGIEAMRQKLMFDLKTEADKMKDAILRNKEDEKMNVEEDENERESPPLLAADGARTWNLRTRRAEWKIPFSDGGLGGGSEKPLKIDENSSPARTDGGTVKLLKLRSNSNKSAPRPKFSLQLSRKEVEEDFIKMVGHRPPRRPNKRPSSIRKQLDGLVPGSWLTEVTADLYKVAEDAGNGKARQSGKGKGKGKGKDKMLVSSDSDEES